jgi:subtilisin family serine protease
MAEKDKQTTAASTGSEGGMVKVLVEVMMPAGQDAEQSLSMAAGLNITGFQLDTSYEPVPMDPPEDLAADLEADGNAVVVVLGTIDPKKISDLENQDNVLSVTPDFNVAPFGVEAMPEQDEDILAMVSSDAFGTCPIPTCDCQPRTPKGSISDVAKYLGADQVWADGNKGQGVIVGVVDGGISAAGRVKGGTIPNVIGGYRRDWGTRALWGGHGNMCATDVLGIAPQVKLYDLMIAVGGISATISAALAAFNWSIKQYKAGKGPHILTNSWGIYQRNWDENYATKKDHIFTRKVVEAVNTGIIVLFAAGNCGERCPSGRCGKDTGPGKSIWGANGHPKVITVGAANIKNQWIGYSSQGPAALDKHKPDITSISHFKGYFSSDTGTSAACPVAAGVAALLKQCKPSITPKTVKKAMKETAKDIGPKKWDQHSGSGIINAKAAYDEVCEGTAKDPCRKKLAAANRYLEAYKKTKNRRYLCLYYLYFGAYYCCRYRAKKNRRFLCTCYYYYALYYRCQHQVTKKRRYLCFYYSYLAAYYCCMYQVTKNRNYLCACYRYRASYYSCMYQETKNRKHLCAYYKYLAAYYCCLYRVKKDRRHLCACYRYYSAFYNCQYRATKDRRYLCLSYLYRARNYCCLYRIKKDRRHLCACYRYFAAGYCCLYRITKSKKYLTLCQRYTAAARKCK